MEIYHNTFHSGHLYLRIDEGEAETIAPSRFDALLHEYGQPLQVMIPSTASKLVSLLLKAGFVLKRRCYEMDVISSDLCAPLPECPERLCQAQRGTSAYDACAVMLYRYYRDTHAPVNPLTASLSAFVEMLPDTAVYTHSMGAAAFIEGNEIAYLCSISKAEFPGFARSLLAYMLDRHNSIVFEADDTDWAAMQLRAMFSTSDMTSFDTYVKSK